MRSYMQLALTTILLCPRSCLIGFMAERLVKNCCNFALIIRHLVEWDIVSSQMCKTIA